MTVTELTREAGDLQIVDAIEPLAEEWDDLAIRSGASPFARPGWVGAWWAAFGRGSLSIFTLRRDGELAAVLPLARRRGMLRSCSNAHTPVLDCAAAAPADAAALLGAAIDDSHAVLLERVDTMGSLSAAARAVADASGSRLFVFEELVAPYVDPTMSSKEYEQSLGSSRRHHSRRKRRRLAEAGELSFLALDGSAGAEAVEERFAQMLDLEASGWKASTATAIRSRPETLRFYTEVVAWGAQSGLLRLSFLCLDGRPLVGWLLIGDETHQYSLKTGYDEEFSRYSPGVLLAIEEVGHALDGGRSFELGPPMNRLKQDLHNQKRRLEQVGLFRRGVYGTVGRWAVQGRDAAYRKARGSELLRKVRDAVRRRLASTHGQIPVIGEALLAAGALQSPVG